MSWPNVPVDGGQRDSHRKLAKAINHLLGDGAPFVRQSNALDLNLRTITASAAAAADDYMLLCDATSAAITVTLPAAASNAGRVILVKKIDVSANAVTIDGAGAETIDGAATQSTTTQWTSFSVQCDGTGWFIV